jgi:hypothetical protein
MTCSKLRRAFPSNRGLVASYREHDIEVARTVSGTLSTTEACAEKRSLGLLFPHHAH